MTPRTAIQVLRSWWLGGYWATVAAGELKVVGPAPMSPSLKASVRARRGELVELLTTYCGGTWPPAPGAVVADNEERALFMLEIPGQVAEPPVTVRPRRKVAA
ncbi:MAG: hypothetical protein H0V53_14055 [Rubrobacter sp.]|nr:hypothetical protein [Rubrobacter sp.]